ncbi:MAG: beta-galactosidase [Chloroflexi bacterium]|nr:beta-galactosidase [Chloroflexota bacterium]
MIDRKHHLRLLLVALLTLLALTACGGDEEEPTPTPTKTSVPAQVESAPAPTDTPVPATAAQPVAQPAAPAVVAQPIFAVVDATELNVRSGPGTSFDIVRAATEGQRFELVAVSDDGTWAQLSENGATIGWTALKFLTIEGDPAALKGGAPAASQPGTGNPPAAAAPAAPASGPFADASMSSPDFGAQAFLWWREEIARRDLELMNEAGFRWVKQAFAWETIEGAGKGQYDWSLADRVVQQANASGLKLLARVSSDPDKTNFWAGQPPGNASHFADFLFALADRYNCAPNAEGCIQAYQVWNEPNLAREWGGNRPNPAEYVRFLGQAYAAIKRANANALVINAGMAPTGDDSPIAMPDDKFYDQMYQAMGGNSNGYFDALGVHGAGFAAPPELDPATAAADKRYGGYRFFAFRHVEDIRNIMVRYGDTNKKVVILEFGWTYDSVNPAYKWHGADAGIDMFVQADYLKRAYQYAAANWQPWIGLMSLLTMPNLDWMNDGNPNDEEQYWWAIMEPSNIDEKKWRPAIIELCIYFNGVTGQKCKYDPN